MRDMTIVDHLDELRNALVKSLWFLVGGFAVSYYFGEQITEFLLVPLHEALGKGEGKIIYTNILDKVLSQFQLSLWSGFFLSSPFAFFQIWRFLAPALYPHEKKVVKPFLVLGFLLFVTGILFGYYILFPLFFDVLLNFGISDVEAYINLKEYIVLMVKVLVFLGLIFQLPNLMIILNLIGVTSVQTYKDIRKYCAVGFAIFSAIITPPDVITMMGVWIPLMVLYECGIFFNYFVSKKIVKKDSAIL